MKKVLKYEERIFVDIDAIDAIDCIDMDIWSNLEDKFLRYECYAEQARVYFSI